MNKRQLSVLLSGFFIVNQALAALTLPSVFSDNMMLQQNTKAKLWGTDKANSKVTVTASWGETVSTTADNKGSWRVSIPTGKTGLDYTLTINGSDQKVINKVAVGEVWLCSGQSNMQITLLGNLDQPIFGSQDAILTSANENIRLFSAQKTESLTPQSDVSGSWAAAKPASVADFSATCYFFGRKLEQVLNTPVGLILSAKGASSAEAWTPKETLEKIKIGKIPTSIPKKNSQKTPTVLFNGMIHPLIGYTIKGFTWYQGEGNRERAGQYKTLFSSMINSWRDLWQQEDLPFYFVQLAPYGKNRPQKEAAFLREAQLKTMQTVKNTGMVSALDIGNCTNIHPGAKQEVGERLAYWAFAKQYNIPKISYSGPIYKNMKIKGKTAMLSFDHAKSGLTSYDRSILGLEVAGVNKKFYPAEGKISRGLLEVSSDNVKIPVAVRYAFENCIEGRLFNTAGLPAPSFRTDNW